jgi:hypothetical protein
LLFNGVLISNYAFIDNGLGIARTKEGLMVGFVMWEGDHAKKHCSHCCIEVERVSHPSATVL